MTRIQPSVGHIQPIEKLWAAYIKKKHTKETVRKTNVGKAGIERVLQRFTDE